jgi:hypothetical protein
MSTQITSVEEVAFRDFLSKVKPDRFRELMRAGYPAGLTAKQLLDGEAEGIARVAAMNSGYDEAVTYFFDLSQSRAPQQIESGHRDMT